jgi:serine acetyltransferase
LFNRIREDIRTVFREDPAARSVIEVLFCYPGLHAIWNYRIAHFFWQSRAEQRAKRTADNYCDDVQDCADQSHSAMCASPAILYRIL